MKKSFHKGFTLIELLVVVAIIALLAATILASLGGARTKARDARTTSELSSMRAQAELYYNNHTFSYGTAGTNCADTANLFGAASNDSLKTLLADVISYAGGSSNVACATDGNAWAVSGKLSTGFFCVDSNGTSKAAASSVTTAAGAIASNQCAP
ncbi:MAG: gspG [Patescibacteria group bacterium]|nr:gspG [Patescibacteria group bacterium]